MSSTSANSASTKAAVGVKSPTKTLTPTQDLAARWFLGGIAAVRARGRFVPRVHTVWPPIFSTFASHPCGALELGGRCVCARASPPHTPVLPPPTPLPQCCGEAATFPLDFTKVRLQLQNELGKTLTGEAAVGKGKGMFTTFVHIFRTEGLLAMYGGLSAAALRQFVYGGIGVGLYVPMRTLVIGADVDPKTAPLWKRILAGALSGSLGQLAANPFDVVKVRLQADGRLKSLGQAPRYVGAWDALKRIPVEEGVAGYFKGLGPSIGRAAVINGCGIASYDASKTVASQVTGRTEGLVPQVLASLVSGLVSALVSTPFDVIKTRMMNQPRDKPLYSSAIDCVVKTARAEGVLGLYKGFVPAYSRLAPHRVVHFVALENVSSVSVTMNGWVC